MTGDIGVTLEAIVKDVKERWKAGVVVMAAMAGMLGVVTPSSASPFSLELCESSSSDPDDDGWGWENGQSCIMSTNEFISRWRENQATPANTDSTADPTSATTPADATPAAAAEPVEEPDSNRKVSSGSPVKSNGSEGDPDAGPQCVGPGSNSNSPGLRYGDFLLTNNAWNSQASNGDWSQCISLTTNPDGSVSPQWTYDWLNEDQATGPVWAVKAFPELLYGTKAQGEVSADKATTGLPVVHSEAPNFTIDYSYSASETTKRSKQLNGQTVYGDRNVAIETFFHSDCTIRRGSSGSNRIFEVMLWLEGGPERRPDGAKYLQTTVTIDGQEYDVYTKPDKDPGYIAFYAKNPVSAGSIDWSNFLNWAKDNGPTYGTSEFQPGWCMANILFGSEIWWGEGSVRLNNLEITRE